MPWAAGTYSKGNNGTGGWTGDASLGIGIEAGRHDTQDNDFATGINQCLNKDGSNSCTGDLNLGGFKPVNVAAGTAAAPAICAGGDVNTGIFSPAADQIGIATNGTERVRIDNTGKVLVGRTAPVIGETIGSTGYGIVGSTTGDGQFIFGSGGSSTVSGSYDNTPHIFRTNNTERMRIDSAGNVGIGVSSFGNIRTAIRGVDSTSSNFAFFCDNSSASELFVVRNDGQFRTGVAASSPYNNTTGSAPNVFVTSGGILQRQSSSAKYKTDIVNYTHGLEAVNALRPVFYKNINDGDKQFAGLIAEEVHDAGLHEFVVYNADNEPDALHYSNMVALAFKAIQELNAKVEVLEARVAELEP